MIKSWVKTLYIICLETLSKILYIGSQGQKIQSQNQAMFSSTRLATCLQKQTLIRITNQGVKQVLYI